MNSLYLPQLAHLPATGQLHATPPYKWATAAACPIAAIHGHPGAPCRLAASPSRASHPIPARLSRGARITPSHLANWSIPFASTHARNSPRAPDACCLAPAVSAGRSAAPALQCSGAAWPASCVQRSVVRSDSWGAHGHRVLATSRAATGQWPCRARGPGRPPCLDPVESVNAMQNPFRPRWVSPGEVEWPTGE
ncbi:hypothetical protein AAWM_02991 [Aspergillus awamori]|uniref:Uncharacterized protein n=1 Tax=Aspergillus awamori TaxID=105351 RepID=A0A401KLP9_ASPAW|nr:hypothetical protein AAWM_02991 [Aspergillus awamori]